MSIIPQAGPQLTKHSALEMPCPLDQGSCYMHAHLTHSKSIWEPPAPGRLCHVLGGTLLVPSMCHLLGGPRGLPRAGGLYPAPFRALSKQ